MEDFHLYSQSLSFPRAADMHKGASQESSNQVKKVVISTHEVTQPRSPKKIFLLLQDSYSLKGPGTVYDNPYDRSIMVFKDQRTKTWGLYLQIRATHQRM